jgi:hypothetical protein
MKKVDSLRQIVEEEIGTDPSNRISPKRHGEENASRNQDPSCGEVGASHHPVKIGEGVALQ